MKFASTVVSFSNCLRNIIQRYNLTSIISLFYFNIFFTCTEFSKTNTSSKLVPGINIVS